MARAPKYEGSAQDKAKDKRLAKKKGMTLKAWEKSSADRREDAKGQKVLDKKAKRQKG